ncbi:relaxase/mobilization nuclease domain-containing protein [Ruminococcus flavefaciens]|uniref:Relaxase/Mobilisation nuclease domain-containing protein n=1 Tax=Ruminococcus flavefaciens TaxID=1265 RepID=A0A1K1MFS9_RUMFL|nr:relaxase/mobilization nuclease domain-containing protein [Ruminococcus flavefaciens]SFW22002.1 Relaxase/Mobilisation nuclease domain-containing protein [Ruminococcus flavefaciens]
MSIVKDVNVNGRTFTDSRSLHLYLTDDLKTDGGKNIAALGFITENFIDEFQAVKVAHQKTGGRQFRQITIAPSPAGTKLTPEKYLDMGIEIGEFYYDLGFQVFIVFHNDTDTPHLHLMINSVNFITGKMFSQSKSELNRFKLHCNHVFDKYGLDPIGKPVEMMMDNVIHDLSEGFDCLELFDEIMADKAISLSDLYKEPVTEHQPLYTPEYTRGGSIICEPTKTRNYFNPDSPTPWCKLILYPDNSWGVPNNTFDEFTNHLIRFMSLEDQQKVRALFPQRKYYRRKEISGKQFTENPDFFLNNHCEINVLVESEAELENVIAIFNKLRYIAEAEKAYGTKLGLASMAQLNQLGVSANVTADNSTTLNVTIRGKDGSEQTINEFIDIPNKN